jgi:hypothetical protein
LWAEVQDVAQEELDQATGHIEELAKAYPGVGTMTIPGKQFSVFLSGAKVGLAARHDLHLGFDENTGARRGLLKVKEFQADKGSPFLAAYFGGSSNKLDVTIGVLPGGYLLRAKGKLVALDASSVFKQATPDSVELPEGVDNTNEKYLIATVELTELDLIG